MNDLVKLVLPASLALAGTVAGLVFAYRQWKGRARAEAALAFSVDRRAAYKLLWERLEAVHAYARSLSVDRQAFDAMIREVNLQMMQREVFLEVDEREIVNAYLSHLEQLGLAAAAQSSAAVQQEVFVTGPGLSTSAAKEFAALREAFDQVDSDRRELLPRFRAVLAGEPLRAQSNVQRRPKASER